MAETNRIVKDGPCSTSKLNIGDVITGAAGAVVSTVIITSKEGRDVPASLIAVAVKEWVPSDNVIGPTDERPSGSGGTSISVPPSYTLTVEPVSERPDMVNVLVL